MTPDFGKIKFSDIQILAFRCTTPSSIHRVTFFLEAQLTIWAILFYTSPRLKLFCPKSELFEFRRSTVVTFVCVSSVSESSDSVDVETVLLLADGSVPWNETTPV